MSNPKEVHYDIMVDGKLRLKIRLYKNEANELCHDFHLTEGTTFTKIEIPEDPYENRLRRFGNG